jgi:ABC-type Co2+ transport system permease subunit
LAAGWAITVVFIAIAIWWSKKKGIEVEVIPKLSLMAAVFSVMVKPELIGSLGGDGKP